jgi:hypothetical protein
VLVLALFFGTRPTEFLFTWHKFTGWLHELSGDVAQLTQETSAKSTTPRSPEHALRASRGAMLRAPINPNSKPFG